MTWWVLLIGLSAGAAVALQFSVNSQLEHATGHPLWAALISFLVGTTGLAIMILVQRIPLPATKGISNAPAWIWMGGLFGASYVVTAIVLVPRVGVAVLAGLVVTGQLIAALLLDHYGLFSAPVTRLTIPRVVGAALIILGLFLMRTPK